MKNILVCLLVALSGCSSMPDKSQQCATATAAYEAYQAISATRVPSKDEKAAAAGAAVFLAAYCGWKPLSADPATKEIGTGTVDKYGVPIVVRPQ